MSMLQMFHRGRFKGKGQAWLKALINMVAPAAGGDMSRVAGGSEKTRCMLRGIMRQEVMKFSTGGQSHGKELGSDIGRRNLPFTWEAAVKDA